MSGCRRCGKDGDTASRCERPASDALRVWSSYDRIVGGGILVVAATEAELGELEGLVCGVGPVEAAVAVARELERSRPSAILHVGVAGARAGSGLRPPQLVVGEAAVYEDLVISRPLAPTEVAPDPRLLAAVEEALPEAAVVRIGTTGRVGGVASCPVEAMEGFAVLRAAELGGVPAVEVRAISNQVDDPRSEWRLEEAVAAIRSMLPRLLEALASD
jgi:nucleoside phosphorylase